MASEYEYAMLEHRIPGMGEKPPNEKRFVTTQDARKELLKLLKGAARELQVVWGEGDHDFFEQDDTLEALRSLLASGAAISIIFSKDVPNIQAAETELERANPKLWKLWGLFESSRKRFKLYWRQRKLQQRYAIVDGRDLYRENPKYKPNLTIITHNEELASTWARRFEALAKKHCNLM
jgi:phosphatidylserine/phosphatidylglycerophosphate/cardiolipin synthase-like enzyme